MSYKEPLKNYILNVLIVLIFLSVSGFAVNQWAIVKYNHAVSLLEKQPPSSFFGYYSITPSQPSYPVGVYPSFWYDTIYHLTGSLSGDSVLICDNYRSNVYKASGFVSEASVNKRPAFPNAFTVNSDLPPFPTTCFLRSTITHCSETYPQVCKTQSLDSSEFKYE